MSEKKTKKHSFLKQARVALVLSLSLACSLTPWHEARAQLGDGNDSGTNAISPQDARQAFGPHWREILKSYKLAQRNFAQKQQERLKDARMISFTEAQNMQTLINDYPFLREKLQSVIAMQKRVGSYMQQHPGVSLDTSAHIYTAQSRDSKSGDDVFFLEERGSLFCSAHGCPITIFVGSGDRYTVAMNYIGDESIAVSRSDKSLSLFFDPQSQNPPLEWILKDHRFVQNPPPPYASQSPIYEEWHQEQIVKKAQELDKPEKKPAPSGATSGNGSASQPGASNDTFVP